MTLDEWAVLCWDSLVVRPRTLNDYKHKYRKNISPTLGQMQIDKISRRDIQAWVLSLSPTVGRAAYPILRTLFREAISFGLLEQNPANNVKRKPHSKRERDWLTLAEIKALDFKDHPEHGEFFLFLAMHGLRWSEALNLRQSDFIVVNERRYINVVRSEAGLATKSGRSRLVPYVGHWNPRHPRNHKWALHVFKEATGNPAMTLHSLRYTYAHWLKSRGVPPQTAQKLLGHSTIVLTMDLYTRVMPDEIDAAADLLRMDDDPHPE